MRRIPRPSARRAAVCSALLAVFSFLSGCNLEFIEIIFASLGGFELSGSHVSPMGIVGQTRISATYTGRVVTVRTIGSEADVESSFQVDATPITGVSLYPYGVLVTTETGVYSIRYFENQFSTPEMVDEAGAGNRYLDPAVRWVSLDNSSVLTGLVFAIRGSENGVYVKRLLSGGGFAPRAGASYPLNFVSSAYVLSVKSGLLLSTGGPFVYVMRFDGVDRMIFVNAATGEPTEDPGQSVVTVSGNPACSISKINTDDINTRTVFFPAPPGCSCLGSVAVVGSDGRLGQPVPVGCADGDQPLDETPPADVQYTDFNNDGIPDLIFARPDRDEVGIRIGLASGGFGPERAFPVPGIDSLRIAFLDYEDDFPDILAGSTARNSTTYLFNNRNGGVYTRSHKPGTVNPSTLLVADFDGDGRTDSLTQSGPAQWRLYRGDPSTPNDFLPTPNVLTGPFLDVTTPPAAYRPPAALSAARRIAFAESAGNRISTASVSVGPNNTGTFNVLQAINLPGPPPSFGFIRAIAATDLDGDGDDDLAVALPPFFSTDPTVAVLRQNADGTFAAPVPYTFPFNPGPSRWIITGNFIPGNGPDIMVENGILRNNGGGSFTVIRWGGITRGDIVTAADVDGDGSDDLIGSYQTAGGQTDEFTTFLFLNNGDGTFLPGQSLLTTDTLPEQITIESTPSTTDGPGPKILSLTIRASNAINARRLFKQIILQSSAQQIARANSSTYLDLGTGQVNFFLPPQGVAPADGAPAPRSPLVVASNENGPFGGLSVYPSIGAAIAPCIGDATRDRRVDFFDLNTVLAFYGTSQPIGKNGDVSYDGVVNFDDLNLVLSRYGSACSP